MSAVAVVLGTTTVTCGVELVRFRHAFDAEVLARANELMAVANEAAAEAGGTIQIGVGKDRVFYGI